MALTPVDNRFMDQFRDLQKRLSQLERNTQPQKVDWFRLVPSDYERVTSPKQGIKYVAGITRDINGDFKIGDKVRIGQSGNNTYYYVVEIVGGVVYLAGGDANTIGATAFEDVSVSNAPQPTGFPTKFQLFYDMSGDLGNLLVERNSINSITEFNIYFKIDDGVVEITAGLIFVINDFALLLGLAIPTELQPAVWLANTTLNRADYIETQYVEPAIFPRGTAGSESEAPGYSFITFTPGAIPAALAPEFFIARTVPFDRGVGDYTPGTTTIVSLTATLTYELKQ